MGNTGKDRLTRLVDAAFDESTDEISAADSAKLAQFQKLATRLQAGRFGAPDRAIELTKSLVPKPERQWLSVRLLGSTKNLAGVRLENGDETQVVLDADGIRVRLMYGRTPTGWEIIGKVEGDGWTAVCSGNESACEPEGRFLFTVREVVDTGIRMYSNLAEFEIPPFKELVEGASGLDRPS